MALTGGAMIRPVASSQYNHAIRNVKVEAITGADGVHSVPSTGAMIRGLTILNAGGLDGYALLIGAGGFTASGGLYSDILITNVDNNAIVLDDVTDCILTGLDISWIEEHGILLQNVSDRNVFNGVRIERVSRALTDTYDSIHITDGDDNVFDAIYADSIDHKSAADFSGGTGNKLGTAHLVPGQTDTFLETAPGDNDFGLTQDRWIVEGVLATSTGSIRLPFLVAAEVVYIELWVDTAPTDADLVVDINKTGTSIFPTSTLPTVTATAFTDIAIPDTTDMAAGDYLTFDVDQIGSTIAGSDLTVTVHYRAL